MAVQLIFMQVRFQILLIIGTPGEQILLMHGKTEKIPSMAPNERMKLSEVTAEGLQHRIMAEEAPKALRPVVLRPMSLPHS